MFCRKCGEKLQPEDDFCGSCGSAASTLSRSAAPEADKSPTWWKAFSLPRLLAAIVVFVINLYALRFVEYRLSDMVPHNDTLALFSLAIPFVAAYIAYRWGWRNKYFISK
jgi:uncharacterized membrane protein YvbJ